MQENDFCYLTLTIAYPEITVSESEWNMQTYLGQEILFMFISIYYFLFIIEREGA